MYSSESVTMPPSADEAVIQSQPNRIRTVPGSKKAPNHGEAETMLAAYLALVSQVDHGIGLILDELEASGELENTIIVFSADHGDYAGEHGLWSKHGGISSRAITRIPLIVRLPGAAEDGRVRDEIIEAVDVFPTICEFANIPIPDHIQGKSFASLMSDDAQPIRENALTENPYRKALATKEWRYIANIGDQPDELYDQINDPWETNNLIDDPEFSDVSRKLLRQLFARVARAQRPINAMSGGWTHNYDRDGRALMQTDPNIDEPHL